MNIKHIIKEKKEIKDTEYELSILKKEYEESSLECTRLKSRLLEYSQGQEHSPSNTELSNENFLPTLFTELCENILGSTLELVQTINNLDYDYIDIRCKSGFDFENYNIDSDEVDMPAFNYDLGIYVVNKDNKVLHFQKVHCFGILDGGLYNPFACKRRESQLETLIFISSAIKNILEENLNKKNIRINILDIEEFRQQITYKNQNL